MSEVFDKELDNYYESIEDIENTCLECGELISAEKSYCSQSCYKANQH